METERKGKNDINRYQDRYGQERNPCQRRAKNITELEAELGSISKMTDEELATTLTALEKEKGL